MSLRPIVVRRLNFPGILLTMGISNSLSAQEGVAFDPAYMEPPIYSWENMAIGIPVGLGCYGFWRFLVWLAATKQDSTGWSATRYWLPTAMVSCLWLLILGVDNDLVPHQQPWGMLFGFVVALIVLINLPVWVVLVPVQLVLGLLPTALWVVAVFATLLIWFVWYGIVRFMEHRAQMNSPISLRIGLVDGG